MSLSSKTEKWVQHHLITAKQRKQILSFEQKNSNRTFWRTAFIIAALLIGLGICLLVAANWAALPNSVKLIGNFTLLGSFSYAVFFFSVHKKEGWKELFTVLACLMVGATFGLNGQIFQLQGSWHSLALAWALFCIPFVLHSRASFLNIGWWLLLLNAMPPKWWSEIFSYAEKNLDSLVICTLLGLILLHYVAKRLDQSIRHSVLLPSAMGTVALWLAYGAVVFIGIRWGLVHWHNTPGKMWGGWCVVFLFLAVRMAWAVYEKNIGSFKRNAFLVEMYIFAIFASRFGNLWTSGLGFIIGGMSILLLIYLLKKTTSYIKKMEVFQ